MNQEKKFKEFYTTVKKIGRGNFGNLKRRSLFSKRKNFR